MKFSNKILFRQEGGPMPAPADPAMAPEGGAPAPAPAPEGGNPQEAIQQLAGQLVEMLMQQVGDPQAVTAILQTALDMVGSAMQNPTPIYQLRGGKMQRIR